MSRYLPIFHLVSCVGTKVQRKDPMPARDLYCSRWFKLVRQVIEQRGEPWGIISAKYRLIMPDAMIFAYDETLSGKTREQREEWADKVLMFVPKADRYVIWGSVNYHEFLAPMLSAHLPLHGLGIGQQLGYLKRLADPSPALLDTCRAALDLLIRCDAETTPNDLAPASDFDWDTVRIQLQKAITFHEAKADDHRPRLV